jgi:3-oxoacyl-[acyl-carrier protein] reductase
MTRNLAHELPDHGITIVGVCPGHMISEGLRYGLEHPEEFPDLGPLFVANFSRVTIGRCSLPEEAANVVAFLASDAGAYIHGTTISVGGGESD